MFKIKPVLITDGHSRKWDWSFKSQIITCTNSVLQILIYHWIQIRKGKDKANKKQNKPISSFEIGKFTFYSFSQTSNWGFFAPFSRGMLNVFEESHPGLPNALKVF